ncbi:MAG: glycosyltransferase family 4 protein, partial [Desulfamplus sp.]|nr:glycosyltransferase family 4 protein [Desulfamplus sp.]
LCGGVKVVFNHAAALTENGHSVYILSPAPYPSWFNKRVPFYRLDLNLFHTIPSFNDIDFIIATCPLHLPAVYDYLYPDISKLVHLVQGYEPDCAEAEPFIDMITKSYSLNIPKITVSDRLSQRLSALYPGKHFMTCGQGLENDIFYPPEKFIADVIDTVILIGAFDISVKRIADGLCAFKRALEKKENLKLVRISAVDTKTKEEALTVKIDEYHVGITPCEVGELLRRPRGVLVSPSSSGEGFGLPPLEAMACGIPTVLSDIPSYRAFSSPADYALFVPVGDIEQMADAIIELSENGKLRYQLIKRGLEVAGEYSYSKVVERLERCLSTIAKLSKI